MITKSELKYRVMVMCETYLDKIFDKHFKLENFYILEKENSVKCYLKYYIKNKIVLYDSITIPKFKESMDVFEKYDNYPYSSPVLALMDLYSDLDDNFDEK